TMLGAMLALMGKIRALVHVGFFAVLTIALAFLAVLSAPFDRSGNTVLVLARVWSRLILATAGVRLTVRAHAALDPAQPCVFMANHGSSIDIWVLFVALARPFRFIAKKQLAFVPMVGWAMMAGRFIFIDRKNAGAARETIRVAVDRIRSGC